jgi:hypothetical protein
MEYCLRSGTQSALPLSTCMLDRQSMILLTWTALAREGCRADREEKLLNGRSRMT